MNTLLLSTDDWDLQIDASSNIAMATGGYAIAQDVASACRTFLGECWYDTTLGIPFLQRILGMIPSLQYLKSQFVAAALSVPGAVGAQCFLQALTSSRVLTGQIQVTGDNGQLLTDTNGQTIVIQASALQPDFPWYVTAVSTDAAGP